MLEETLEPQRQHDSETTTWDAAVVGAGYVGVPLAYRLAEAGRSVLLVDISEELVAALNRGESHIGDVPSEQLAPLVHERRIRATTDYNDLRHVDAILIALPTPLSKQREPDLSIVIAAAEQIGARLRNGHLVILESTTYPRTTREVIQPILERTGLKAGRDFHLAFSPERVDPGNERWTTKNVPKVVGGVTPACTERAAQLYEGAVDTVHRVSTPEAAELTKLLENIFRSVNIALVNELAQLCERMDIDVWEVVEAAATKPFGFMRFDPGPGMGGHCLPIDPFYLAFKAREHDFYPEFIELAGKINQSQPLFCVEKIERALNSAEKPVNGSRILILGVSYKAGVGDIRESPALKIAQRLIDLGADVSYHDPYVPALPAMGLTCVDLDQALTDVDLAAIVTAHPELDYEEVVAAVPLVADFRGVTRGIAASNLVRL